jgi:Reverse transcriptase (RNA-dependent DNA polymerase)
MIEVLALDDSPTRSPIYFPRGPQLEGSDEIFDMLARAFFRRADQPIRQHARGETGTLTAEPANSGLFGTPQGGPLSPLLSNLMLDVLDKELETRGLNFVRYADDCNIYVRSQRAGERVMASIERFLNRRLKLKVNKAKSAVARPSKRKFLGFGFMTGRQPRRRIAPQSLARFRSRVRELTRRTRGRRRVRCNRHALGEARGADCARLWQVNDAGSAGGRFWAVNEPDRSAGGS